MRVSFISLLMLSGLSVAHAAGETTALGALKLLPKGAASRLALIEARESKAAPERWHILVHDPDEENGVHEYVVAGGEVVASRSVSQFVETLKPSDVIGADAVKIDSDKAAKVAQQYARANGITATAFDFELKRDGEGAAPLWKVTCIDAAGNAVGQLVLTATKGAVLLHDGFPNDPAAEKPAAEKPVANAPAAAPVPAGADADAVAEKPAEPKKSATASSSRSRSDDEDDAPRRRRRAPDDEPRGGRPDFFHRAGGKLQKFFTGRDTLSR